MNKFHPSFAHQRITHSYVNYHEPKSNKLAMGQCWKIIQKQVQTKTTMNYFPVLTGDCNLHLKQNEIAVVVFGCFPSTLPFLAFIKHPLVMCYSLKNTNLRLAHMGYTRQ